MCGARAALAHFNSLLAVVGGATLVACAVVIPRGVADQAGVVPGGAILVMAPYVLGPLLLVLTHVCVGALHAAPGTARLLLVVYSVSCLLTALCSGGVMGYAGYLVASWLSDNSTDSVAPLKIKQDALKQIWLQPLLSLLPDNVNTSSIEVKPVSAEVVAVLAVIVLTLLLLLIQAALALAARPRRMRDDETPLRPCSSLYYEPSAPACKAPLHDPSTWQ